MRLVADCIAATLKAHRVEVMFGLVGSGNFYTANAITRENIRFITTRHECAAVAAADGYFRSTRKIGMATCHTGPGLTNTILALAEAAKANSSIVVLAADTPAAARNSNSRIDQHGLVESIGAVAEQIYGPDSVGKDIARAFYRAKVERRPVVVMMATNVQESHAPDDFTPPSELPVPDISWPNPEAIVKVADLVQSSARPVIIGGRGVFLADGKEDLVALGDRIGALLATSAMGNGMFHDNPWNIGISGGFATPAAVELISSSDLILGFGATLNQWTTRNGALLNEEVKVVQFDLKTEIRTSFRPADLHVVGDAAAAAKLLVNELSNRDYSAPGYRNTALQEKLENRRFWNQEEYESGDGVIDPRALSDALDKMLPLDKNLAIDGGHFMGWPSMFIRVPDPSRFVFPNASMPVGLGLGAGIGAAIADPDQPTIIAIGDGGALMTLGELETISRFKLPVLVVVYNDAAAGAEALHYGPLGYDLETVVFEETDFASVGEALGIPSISVRNIADLEPVREWSRTLKGPMLIDAKVDPAICADFLEEAFRNSDHPTADAPSSKKKKVQA